jgi:DNA-binding GntR family transcriptional regulator
MRRRAGEYARLGRDEQIGLCALPAAHSIVGRLFVWTRRFDEPDRSRKRAIADLDLRRGHPTTLPRVTRPTKFPGNPGDGFEIIRVDVTQQVYGAIRTRLLSRGVRGGERVNLQAFADELGVSRTPVSNALLRLAAEGLLVSVPAGYVVRPLTEDLLEGLYETRLALELHAVSLTVGRTTKYQLDELEQLMARTREATEERRADAHAFAVSDGAFHAYQVGLAGHSPISEAYEHLWLSHVQARALQVLKRFPDRDAVSEHAAVVEGFKSGDPDAVARAIRADARNDRALCREALHHAGGWI